MKSDQNKIKKGYLNIPSIDEIERIHPYKMILFLSLFGSFLVLLFLLVSLTVEYAHDPGGLAHYTLPKFYIFAAIFIPFSLPVFRKLPLIYEQERILLIRKKLLMILLSGTVLMALLFAGWLELLFQGLSFTGNIFGTFIFLIAGFYLIHLCISLTYIIYQLLSSKNIHNDGVQQLIYFTAPYEKTKLELISVFGEYLTFTWIFIIVWLSILF